MYLGVEMMSPSQHFGNAFPHFSPYDQVKIWKCVVREEISGLQIDNYWLGVVVPSQILIWIFIRILKDPHLKLVFRYKINFWIYVCVQWIHNGYLNGDFSHTNIVIISVMTCYLSLQSYSSYCQFRNPVNGPGSTGSSNFGPSSSPSSNSSSSPDTVRGTGAEGPGNSFLTISIT